MQSTFDNIESSIARLRKSVPAAVESDWCHLIKTKIPWLRQRFAFLQTTLAKLDRAKVVQQLNDVRSKVLAKILEPFTASS